MYSFYAFLDFCLIFIINRSGTLLQWLHPSHGATLSKIKNTIRMCTWMSESSCIRFRTGHWAPGAGAIVDCEPLNNWTWVLCKSSFNCCTLPAAPGETGDSGPSVLPSGHEANDAGPLHASIMMCCQPTAIRPWGEPLTLWAKTNLPL